MVPVVPMELTKWVTFPCVPARFQDRCLHNEHADCPDWRTRPNLYPFGKVLDQFSNPDNPRAHYEGTGPEIWRDTHGKVTHFVSSMGTTGTIMGTSKFLKEQNSNIQVIGVQPEGESKIPGIRRWPQEYLPRSTKPTALIGLSMSIKFQPKTSPALWPPKKAFLPVFHPAALFMRP